MEGLGTLLGPLAAAAILVVATPGSVFLAGAVAALIGALLVVRLPRPGRVDDHEAVGRCRAGARTCAGRRE